jgi:hypothetical protein
MEHLDHVIKQIQQDKENFNLDSTVIQNASINDKLGFLTKIKSLWVKTQFSIDEWHTFSQYMHKLFLNIYQTTFEHLPQQPT